MIGRLHYEIVHGLLTEGACPSNADLALRLGMGAPELEALMKEAAGGHALVLHPHAVEPWVVHPFSLTPTLNFVQGEKFGWWAPCIWCAFGIANLAGGKVTLHTRFGAEAEVLVISVEDGEPKDHHDLVVHFAIPPARAWDNVHQHCALVLPFHNAAGIIEWCERHRQPRGQAVPLTQVAQLARVWYGQHAAPDWKKWSIAQAQEMFAGAGLMSGFWALGKNTGRY